jgi:hypothetical protein
MNTTFASLFAQAPGLTSSFNDIFNNATPLPLVLPPTPAALPPLEHLEALHTSGSVTSY